jgi:hypothetical protein
VRARDISPRVPSQLSARSEMARSGGGRRRRGGAKAKKRTKYLSLSSIIVKAEVGPEEHRAPPAPLPPAARKEDGAGHPQAEPFALHHELFAAVPAPSLSDILGASPSPSSASPDAADLLGDAEEDLPRRALRGRERWVYCCSSPSATTASSSPCSSAASTGASARSLLLKLDYKDVLAAWADRGSLYIANPKPELHNVYKSPSLFKTPPWRPNRLVRTGLGCDDNNGAGAVCAGVRSAGGAAPAAAAAARGGAMRVEHAGVVRQGGASEAVQAEAPQPAVRQADPLRGSPGQRCHAAAIQGDAANISLTPTFSDVSRASATT